MNRPFAGGGQGDAEESFRRHAGFRRSVRGLGLLREW